MVLKLSIKTRKGDAGRHTLLRQFSSTSAVSSAPSTPPISPLCSPAPLSASTSRSESIPPTRRARTRIIPFASPTSTQKTSPPLASPSSQAPSPLASPSSHAGPTRRASLWARVKRRFTSRPTRTPPPETNADAPPAAQFFDVLHDEPETYTRAPALLCATTYLLASAGQLFLDALFATAHIAAHPTSPPRVRCVLRNAAATADRLARLCTVLLVLIYIAARLLLLPPAQLWAGNLFVVPAWAAPTLKVWPKHRPFRPKPGPVPITDFRGLGQYALDMWLQAARAAQPTIYGISHLLFAAAVRVLRALWRLRRLHRQRAPSPPPLPSTTSPSPPPPPLAGHIPPPHPPHTTVHRIPRRPRLLDPPERDAPAQSIQLQAAAAAARAPPPRRAGVLCPARARGQLRRAAHRGPARRREPRPRQAHTRRGPTRGAVGAVGRRDAARARRRGRA
ncbi:uncharacterized protein COLE_04508 [Cutaneotrichosporon oleaginosum]|nr:hypothetical protein COLE_04508 [Cutaneotrichosporon oleaginosum]